MVKNFTGKPPIIIAHRGASGCRPEHTLAAYELAMPAAGYAYALGAASRRLGFWSDRFKRGALLAWVGKYCFCCDLANFFLVS